MKAKKQLIVCLTVCFVVSFVSAGNAASLAARGSAPVTVVNPVSKPVPVQEVVQQPIAGKVTVKICAPCGFNCVSPCTSLSTGWYGNGTIYTVPTNKRLVIEYFSCKSLGNGTSFGTYSTSYSCSILPSTSGVYVEHWLPTTPYGHPFVQDIEQQSKNPPAFMSAGQRVQLYGDPGSEVVVGAYRQHNLNEPLAWNYDELITFSFSGYLVDAAAPVGIDPE
ncbi:MAG: hypothetical protein RDU01_11955 [Thermodesulfovibrionales bacterium]|nr:hypothetical protein [Thermodesulfovibrionales bacterium]